jgi:hypothetical protein
MGQLKSIWEQTMFVVTQHTLVQPRLGGHGDVDAVEARGEVQRVLAPQGLSSVCNSHKVSEAKSTDVA